MFPFSDNNPTKRWAIVNYTIIGLNAVIFLWWVSLPDDAKMQIVLHRGFVPARIAQLSNPQLEVKVQMGDGERPPGIEQDKRQAPPEYVLEADPNEIYLSVFTCMFLHGGWMHLLGNMWFLFVFGNNIEDRLGHVLYVFFYLLGGLLATACHWAMYPNMAMPVIGASGAVAAVLGAYAITFPFARVKTLIFLIFFITIMELPALVVLGFWFVGQLLEAQGAIQAHVNGNVAWWAHIGGFVAGLIAMPALSALSQPMSDDPWDGELQKRFQIE